MTEPRLNLVLDKSGLAPVARVPVRRVDGTTYTAYQTAEHEVHTIHGRRATVYPGDWVITDGGQVLEVLPQDAFDRAYAPVEETLTLTGHTLAALESKLGPGTTASPAALLRAVDRLARLEIGQVAVDFTPGQMEEIAIRAKKRGLTFEQEVRRTVKGMEDAFFRGAPLVAPSGG